MDPTTATTTFEDWKLVLLTGLGTPGLVLALAAAALALGLSGWGYRREPRRWIRALLVGVRALGVLGVLALVLQPAIQMRNVTRLPNHLALATDLSRSMALREQPSGPTRLARSVALLQASSARVRQWRRERVVSLFSFGESLKPLGPEIAQLQATEQATRIQSALLELKRRYKGKDLAAVVLISDGIDTGALGTRPLSAASKRALGKLGFPVHTAWVGRPGIQDLAVAEVFADHFGFVRNAMRVDVDLLVVGLDQVKSVPVTLRAGNKIVARQVVQLKKGKRRYRVRLEFVPQQVGKFVYTVAVPALPGEALTGNNRRDFVLKVIRDRIRVLQLCGRPSWDERFLRRLLKRDPNVDLISFFILRTPADTTGVDSSELSLIPFPTDELFRKELGSFDLVILQNFNYGPYGIGGYLPHLRRYVEGGGGLAMIGGDLSFTSGGYASSVLAPVLPVRLLPAARDSSRLVSVEDFRPRVTRKGRDHPILQVARDRRRSLQVLAALPSLSGVNLVAGAAPGATVLLSHPLLRARGAAPMPVLATMEAGRGRTLALTTDTSWHWAFLAAGAGGNRQAYDRLWRNAIRWLIRDPELKYLRVIANQDRVRLGAPIKVVVRAFTPDYSPAAGVEVSYDVSLVSSPGGTVSRATTDAEGELRLELTPGAKGAYRVRARAALGGRVNTEQTLVLVDPAGPEDREPAARPDLLKALAQATGGRYLGRPESLPELAFRTSTLLQVNWRRDMEIWDRWWFLLLAVGLLATEWLLRRRFGYL